MKIHALPLAGVFLVETAPFKDSRGEFCRLYCRRELAAVGVDTSIAQVNRSLTRSRGAVRGMHFQHAPMAEIKIVHCVRGRVFDVAIDLREGSPTFLQWRAEELSSEAGTAMVIPEGCAHGFQVLEPNSELLYLHTAPYSPEHEGGVRCTDPRVGIDWPLPPRDLSRRDQSLPMLAADFQGLPGYFAKQSPRR
ncbi:MAG: dTDP-4-keto-6-deoxy-D-glucose epimerase [Desulfovibrio sp.]|nr:MAG: dTDP-4-keto-6-deoxy-D-glucose epimerase [Desulfovibrio sp.]